MSPKTLVFHQDARQLLLNGANALAEAVQVTLGPGGRSVIVSIARLQTRVQCKVR